MAALASARTRGREPRLEPVAAHVLPRRNEGASMPIAKRHFPSDYGALAVEPAWRSM